MPKGRSYPKSSKSGSAKVPAKSASKPAAVPSKQGSGSVGKSSSAPATNPHNC